MNTSLSKTLNILVNVFHKEEIKPKYGARMYKEVVCQWLSDNKGMGGGKLEGIRGKVLVH